MQPSIEMRLRTMMKALSEVVMPAIDPTNRMALEQAGVVLGSMDMLREQIDFAHWYETVDLKSLCRLAAEMGAVSGLKPHPALAVARDAARPLMSRSDVTLTTLRNAAVALREAISLCIEVAGEQNQPEVQKAIQRLVLDHSREQIGRERAYVAGTKWDGFPESLQTIQDSLRAATD